MKSPNPLRVSTVSRRYRNLGWSGFSANQHQVRLADKNLSGWLESCAEGLRQALERSWLRVQAPAMTLSAKLVLRPKQDLLRGMLRDHRGMTPAELRAAVSVSRQGAMNLLNPLLDAGLGEALRTPKKGRYALPKR